jgi:hypothetical protein
MKFTNANKLHRKCQGIADTRSHLQSSFYQEMRRSEVFTGA